MYLVYFLIHTSFLIIDDQEPQGPQEPQDQPQDPQDPQELELQEQEEAPQQVSVRRKRRLIVDEITELPNRHIKSQIDDTSDICVEVSIPKLEFFSLL